MNLTSRVDARVDVYDEMNKQKVGFLYCPMLKQAQQKRVAEDKNDSYTRPQQNNSTFSHVPYHIL